MDQQTRPLDKTAVACGILALAMGLFIVLSAIGIIPSRDADWSSRCIGFVAGLAFVLGGIAVVVQTLARASPQGDLPPGTPMWIRATILFLGLAIVASLAVIGTWIAFGPGGREFSSSIPFLPAWLNEPLGRTVFGIGAMLTWLFLLLMAVMGARRLRGRKEL
jgi:hypothetical protein